LCKAAGINRGTFYKHYSATFDLLEEIQGELYAQILESVQKASKEMLPHRASKIFSRQ
jgi:AcrR family transcriptional regulator